jgi:gamma-glutamyltranspeptidase / glutathione hydrolase
VDEDGTAPDVGDTIRNRDLARTYRMIARDGPRAFYRGELAEAIVEAVTSPPVGPEANHRWRPGLMTEQDLRSYEALRRDPTHMTYRGLDVWGMGPPSSGGSTVGETLNILEGYSDLATDRTRACISSSSPRASRSPTATARSSHTRSRSSRRAATASWFRATASC